ncbi:MAG: hypothetical protein J6O73_09060 [Lachnospiraceae bacterium]|nr:hypothetical protein [Lachnospiraceae bacterium]
MKKIGLKCLVLFSALFLFGCGKGETTREDGQSQSEYEKERAEAFNNLRGNWSLIKVYDTESGEMVDWLRTQDKIASTGQDLVSDSLGNIGEGISNLVDKTGVFHQETGITVTSEEINLEELGRGNYKVEEFDFRIENEETNAYYFVISDSQNNGFEVVYYPADNSMVIENLVSGEADPESIKLFERVAQ